MALKRRSSKKEIKIFKNIDELLTLKGAAAKSARHVDVDDLSIEKKAAMVVVDRKIAWVGPQSKVPAYYKSAREVNLKGKTVLPGFVECHTHLIFAGNRSHEFEKRQQGATYQQIAQEGGGILHTVRETRKASVQELVRVGQKRVDEYVRQGVTTLEGKSGYGLDQETEFKILKSQGQLEGPRVVSTYLGAHAVPPEFKNPESYIDSVIRHDLPLLRKKKLADRVDIFVEKGYFDEELARKYLKAAQGLGFKITIHADQMTLSGGTRLAIELNALSADHLIQIKEEEIRLLARSEVTGVLLPASDLYLRCAYPPARRLIDAGARVALATDFNPGTSPTQDLALTGLLARLEMKMSLPEVISAYTLGGAFALGLADSVGSLEVGKFADFVVIDEPWSALFYHAGRMPVVETWREGERI